MTVIIRMLLVKTVGKAIPSALFLFRLTPMCKLKPVYIQTVSSHGHM